MPNRVLPSLFDQIPSKKKQWRSPKKIVKLTKKKFHVFFYKETNLEERNSFIFGNFGYNDADT